VDVNAQGGCATDVQRYTPHLFYKITAMINILLAVAMGWELAQGLALGALLFFCISLSITVWSVLAIFSRVTLKPAGVCLETPLRGRHCVDFRQLVSATENGRLTPAITMVYHPRLESGLLDLDRVDALQLPAVTGQPELLARLQARTPV
jgi:hypothetical protein